MGFYAERVLPRLTDVACGGRALRPWRERACTGLRGEVVEIGFGSGLNVPHYPDAVDTVHAVEPAGPAIDLARDRIAAAGTRVHVERHELSAESIPLADQSCDSALATFVLCTIPDVDLALSEVRRVLKPGGRLHLLEHGRAPDARVARWQHRFEPIQRRVAGGCHLTRRPIELLEAAGFEPEWSESGYGPGPKPWSWFTVGVAIRA